MLTAVPSNAGDPAPGEPSAIAPTNVLVEEIRNGRIVVLIDDEDRENEGDLIFAADFVTADKINFLARFGRGLICMPITAEHAQRLNLGPMTGSNRSVHGTNFTVAIEAAEGVSTGISAADRAHTIRVASRPDAKPGDIVQPGHVFPLVSQPGGVLVRAGHTEACCDLARLAGLTPAAVLCEIMNEDGSMARLPDLIRFAREHQLKLGTIADLIQYRAAHESLIERVVQRAVRTFAGEFDMSRLPRQAQRVHAHRPGARNAARRARNAGARARAVLGARSAGSRPRRPFLATAARHADGGRVRMRRGGAAQRRRVGRPAARSA
jgi:3,4-dihydroxy 2-butanone 4-phosphate synthase / GTP cyclohydrolase II